MNIYLEDNGYDVQDYISAVAAVLDLDKYDSDIRIDLMKKCDGDAGGYCYGDAEDIDIEIATHVQGEALDIETIKTNIAHEMIHAQQIASGRLNDHGIQIVDECLVKVAEWDGEYHTNTKYDDQPWEIDAYAREAQVAQEAKEMLAQWN
jgi:hypothetical protein